MVTQTKPPIGTQVDFTKAKEIKNFKKICYRNDKIGILAYQLSPVTITASTRDALLNGAMSDISSQIGGQGMQVEYGTISWNETPQGSGYYMTDLRIGVVVSITRDYNTGPDYVLTSLKAVSWLNPALVATGMTNYGLWKAWELTNMTRAEPTYLHMVEELVSEQKWVGYPIGEQPPALPDVATIKSTIESQGDIQGALGKFVADMSDRGVATTILANGYGIDVCLYQSQVGIPVPNNPYARSYYYQVHVRFWWDCTTNPDIDIVNATLQGILFTIAVILTLAVAVGIVLGTTIVAYNLTHQESSYTKKTTKYNPDGSIAEVVEESGSSGGPPDWWAWVVPIVVLVGAVTVAGFLWNLRPQRRQEK